ncbi:MAG: ribonuclease P [Sulfolobaceae archaeon]|nr:ribonuclease P [Sulfolobaceae archaeon]
MAEELARQGEIELARKYVKYAIVYSRKTKTKIPLEFKRKFCRKCYVPLIPGLTERRRIKSKILVRTCLICGWVRRYPLRNKGVNKDYKSETR